MVFDVFSCPFPLPLLGDTRGRRDVTPCHPAPAQARGISPEKFRVGCLGAKSTSAGLSRGGGDSGRGGQVCVSPRGVGADGWVLASPSPAVGGDAPGGVAGGSRATTEPAGGMSVPPPAAMPGPGGVLSGAFPAESERQGGRCGTAGRAGLAGGVLPVLPARMREATGGCNMRVYFWSR